jgi:hypothetical protein
MDLPSYLESTDLSSLYISRVHSNQESSVTVVPVGLSVLKSKTQGVQVLLEETAPLKIVTHVPLRLP